MAEEIIIKIDLNKAESEKKLREVEKQLREYKKQLSETEKAIKDNQKAQEELIKAGAKSEQATAEQIAALKALETEYDRLIDTQINETSQVKASADEKRRLVKEIDAESNSINALRSTIGKLTAERNNLDTQSVEGQKRFQELTEQLKEYNEQLNEASQAAGSFKDNIGNYKESVKAAIQETSLFGVSVNDIGTAFNTAKLGILQASGSLNVFKIALAATGIGAIVIILGSLITFLTQTQEGANKLAQAIAVFKPLINGVVSVFAELGKIVFSVVEGFTALAEGALNFFGFAATDSKEVVKNLQEIEKREVGLLALEKQNIAEQERLKNIRDDESRSFAERRKANDDAFKKELERINIVLKLEEEKLKAFQKELELKPKTLRTVDDERKIQGQIQLIAEKKEESLGRQNEFITNQVSLLRDQKALEAEILQINLDKEIVSGKIIEGSQQELNARLDIEKKKRDAILETFKTSNNAAKLGVNFAKLTNEEIAKQLKRLGGEAEKTIAESELNIATIQKDFRDKQIESYQTAVDAQAQALEKQKENQANADAQNIAGLELRVLKEDEFTQARLTDEINLSKKRTEIEAQSLTGNERLLRIQQGEQEIQDLRNTFAENQKQGQQKLFDELAKFNEDTLNLTLARTNAEISANQKVADSFSSLAQSTITNETLSFDQRLSLTSSYYAKQQSLILENQTKQIEAETIATQQQLANEQLTALERERIQFESTQRIKDIQVAAFGEVTASKASNQDAQTEINALSVDNELATAAAIGNAAGGLSQLLGENTVAGKFFAIAQAQINSYLAFTKVLNDDLIQPTFIRPIIGGVILAQGLAQAAKIAGVKVKKAKGGLITGKGTGTSDDIPAMLSNGESVMTAKTTKMFAPQLSAMNVAGGGVPFKFASGGLVGSFAGGGVGVNSAITSVTNNSSISESIVAGFKNIPSPIVTVDDINRVSNRVEVKDVTNTL
jgi:hypothetical protein